MVLCFYLFSDGKFRMGRILLQIIFENKINILNLLKIIEQLLFEGLF